MEKLISLRDKFWKYSEVILIFLLVLFFITEAISKVSFYTVGTKSEIQSITKALVLGFLLVVLLIQKSKNLFYLIILACMFAFGQWFLPNGFDTKTLGYLLKYLFPIALYGVFFYQIDRPKYKLLQFYEYLMVFNSVLIFLALIFEIRYFQSYRGPRFGYNGLLVTSSASTYFYVIGLCYFLVRYQSGFLKNWKFWVVAMAALGVGTKSVALALMGLGLFYIIKYVGSRYFKMGLLSLMLVGALGFAYYLFFINPIFLELKESKGFVTSFLSLRDQLLLEHTLPFIEEKWGVVNYLFGGAQNFEIRPQMELLDLLFFWGIVGSFFYLLYYFKSYFDFNYKSAIFLFVMVLIVLISFLAGNFFYNASVPIYLVILREAYCISFPNAVATNPMSKVFQKNFK